MPRYPAARHDADMQSYQGLDAPAVLARRIPAATHHVVADAGHMISMEQPAAVNELLISFVLNTQEE